MGVGGGTCVQGVWVVVHVCKVCWWVVHVSNTHNRYISGVLYCGCIFDVLMEGWKVGGELHKAKGCGGEAVVYMLAAHLVSYLIS